MYEVLDFIDKLRFGFVLRNIYFSGELGMCINIDVVNKVLWKCM